ncbi:MAG: AraC family transcriptional regulator ligand-binding domain-containing protein, partial [Polyangiales bacterium]
MPSFKAPTGDTTASRIKTLVLYAERSRGRVDADELLQEIGVSRDLIVDETRPVSVAIWRRALEQFARRYGTEAIDQTSSEVVHPSNLGPWIHVVRNAEQVADAYRLLEAPTTNLSSTTRIETIGSGPNWWRGRIHVLHDSALERGGLLSAARRVELSAVPLLFGFPRADVSELASLERGDSHYEYDVRWPSLGLGKRALALAAAAGALFAIAGELSFG